ncbi:MAG: hypothetical protein ACP5QT_03400 [Brevinematia bacterium]
MKAEFLLVFFTFLLSVSQVFPELVTISNNYIIAGMDKKNGRIVFKTLEGDPANPLDNNKALLYSRPPYTSLIAIYVDGRTVIYGSEKGKWLRKPYVDDGKVISAWQYGNISVLSELKPVHNPSTGFPDNILAYCSVKNNGNTSKIGIAIVLDVQLGDKEPRFFNIAERGIFSNETQVAKDDIPLYWSTMDDLENPEIKVQGILQKYEAIKPDRVVFSTWDRLSDLWNLKLNSSYDFRRRGTTQYDGAVGIFYDPKELEYNQTFEAATIYGVMGANIFTEEDFLLTLNIPKEPKELPIPIVAMLVNRSSEEIEKLSLDITLPEGFYLESGEKTVEALKIPPKGSFQTRWEISTEAAGGSFHVKLKADITQKKQQKTMEVEDSFYANFYKESGRVKKSSKEKTTPEEVVAYSSAGKEKLLPSLSSDEAKLKKIEKLISELDQIYESWAEIYRTVFQDKNYKIEQINKALNEIDKEIEYFNNVISNEIKKD